MDARIRAAINRDREAMGSEPLRDHRTPSDRTRDNHPDAPKVRSAEDIVSELRRNRGRMTTRG